MGKLNWYDRTKKPTWDDLSPKERGKYVNQDYVPLSKIEECSDTIESEVPDSVSVWSEIKIKSPNHLKELIVKLHKDGKSNSEIAYHLPCSKRYIRKIVSNFRNRNQK